MINFMPKNIRSFNRYELKYLLDDSAAKSIMEDLKKYMIIDNHGKNGEYYLTSLYYDSDDLQFYWEKIEGIRFRRKLRIRLYESKEEVNANTIVFVEIKQRLNRVTQKRRIALPLSMAVKLCNGEMIEHGNSDSAIVNEVIHMVRTNKLKPRCITSYKRTALNGTLNDPGLRVTFDKNLRFRRQDLDLGSKKLGKFESLRFWSLLSQGSGMLESREVFFKKLDNQ